MALNAIVPEGPSVGSLHVHVVHSRGLQGFAWIRQVWNRAKIYRLGRYSVERMDELDKYNQNTSSTRVLLMCALTPWPALLLELFAEMIPLEDPARGWKANYGAWIRLWIAIASCVAGSLFQIRVTTPELTYMKIFSITIGTGSVAIAMMIVAASLWVFPLPFCMVITGSFGGAVFMVFFLASVSRKRIRIFPAIMIERSLRQKVYLIAAQGMLVTVYVAFSVVFTRGTATLRFGLLLFLPLMKIALKHVVAWIASDNEESIPSAVVFTVDVFNGLYSSICMQSSGTWWAALLMIILNVSQTMLSLVEINNSARVLSKLNRIDSIATMGGSKSSTRSRSPSVLMCSQSISMKTGANTSVGAAVPLKSRNSIIAAKKHDLSARILFHLEYRVLVGYIEAFIPLLYAVHLSILVRLPSAVYYPHVRSLTSDQLRTTITSIVAYVLAEIVSLVWLHIILKRKFGFSLLFQLAYVLETEVEALQGRLFVWIVILLQLTLAHFGTSMF